MFHDNDIQFEELKNELLTKIKGGSVGDSHIIFITNAGDAYTLYHDQN